MSSCVSDDLNTTTTTNTTNHNNINGKRSTAVVTSRTDKHGAPLSEKKLRRLEKNRLSARECRRRKREATEQMQRQINRLEGENLRLRLQLQVCVWQFVSQDGVVVTPSRPCLTYHLPCALHSVLNFFFLYSCSDCQVGEEAEASSQEEQQKLTEVLDDLLKSGASEAEIYTRIEEYKEKFADYGRDRRSAIEFHLRNIERLLMPTQTTSVVLATLQMGSASISGNTPISAAACKNKADTVTSVDASPTPQSTHSPTRFVPDPTASHSMDVDSNSKLSAPPTKLDAKSLFRHLVEILQVTPEQSAALKDSRFVAQEMDECLKSSLGVLKELRLRLTQCGEDLENEFNNVRSILTPTQAAKFLVWVANNKACMHMLNELWNRVYPQQQQQQQELLQEQEHQASTPTEQDMAPMSNPLP